MLQTTTIGLAFRRGQAIPFGINATDRLHHMLILGQILTAFRNAAFSRQSQPEHSRHPYFVSVGEWHNLTSGVIAESLSELRKYGLGLTLAGQYLSKATLESRDVILGNVGTTIAFRLGISDTPQLVRYLQFPSEADLLNLPNHHAYCRLLVEGQQSKEFSMKTLPP